MRWTDVPNLFVAAIWGLLLVSGIQGILTIMSRNVPDYPATGQYVLYVGFPATFLALSGLSAVLSRKVHWFYNLYPFAVLMIAFMVLPTACVWSGGV